MEIYLPDAVTGEPVVTASFTYVFDSAGQLLSETDPLGRSTQHEYDALGRGTALILNDPDGAGPLASPEYHYSFDAASRLIFEVAPNGGETEYEYDLLDNVVLLRLPDPDGAGGASRPEYSYVFDAASQLLSETDPLGRTTLHTLDNLGREIETQTADPDGAGPLEPSVWQYSFDAMSNLVLAIDPLLNETAYQFDHLHRRTKIIDPLSGETSFTFDAASNLLSLTDPVANTTSWVYDTLNRVVEEENQLSASRFFVYNAMNVLVEKTDRNGRVTQYVPDLRGRIIEENWLSSGDPAPDLSVGTTTEGSSTNEVQRVGFSDTSELTGGTFTLTFGAETTDPLAFDADASTVESALTDLTSIGSGNVSVSKLQNGSTDQEWQLTFTGALAAANQSQVAIDSGNVTSTGTLSDIEATDTQGASTNEVQVVTLDHAVAGNFTLSFNSESTDPIPFDADDAAVESALADLTSIGTGNVSVSGSAGGPWTVTFQGTLAGTNVSEITGDESETTSIYALRTFDFVFDEANQLVSAVDPVATFGFVYDGLGRTTEISVAYAGLTPEIVMAQTFDASSARSQLAVSLGETADFVNDFTRDNLGRLTRLEQYGVGGGNSIAEKRVDFSYFADGRFDTISRYADLAGEESVLNTAYSYDDLGRLTLLAHSQDATTLASYAYTYDAGSRITSIDSLADGLVEYTYDHTSQLVGANFASQADETHEWDENGNHAGAGFGIGANNKIATDGTYNYEYDAEGNLILKTTIATGETVSYIWDHRNRLTGVVNSDDLEAITQEVHFAYDFLNRWIARTADADGAGIADPTSLFFVYDDTQIVLELADPESGTPTERYLWAEQVDQLMMNENEVAGLRIPLGDHLNSTRDLAEYDAGENLTSIIDHIVYESFGKVVSESTPTPFRFKFTSRPVDEFTGLQSNWHRWYSVDLGWWLSEDPIGFAGNDANLGRYIANSPIQSIDPTGLRDPDLDLPEVRWGEHPHQISCRVTMELEYRKRHTPDYVIMDQGSSKGEGERRKGVSDWGRIRHHDPVAMFGTAGYRTAGFQLHCGGYTQVLLANSVEVFGDVDAGEDGTIGNLEVWGHGNRGMFTLGRNAIEIKSLSKESPHYVYLDHLRSQLDKNKSTITIRACSVFGGEEGAAFGQALADFFGVPVSSYEQFIAWPYMPGYKTYYPSPKREPAAQP